jgi:hypothetical protein
VSVPSARSDTVFADDEALTKLEASVGFVSSPAPETSHETNRPFWDAVFVFDA